MERNEKYKTLTRPNTSGGDMFDAVLELGCKIILIQSIELKLVLKASYILSKKNLHGYQLCCCKMGYKIYTVLKLPSVD